MERLQSLHRILSFSTTGYTYSYKFSDHLPGAVHDVITPANFCEDRLRGFGAARGRILAFSIDLRRRHYNTLALPCECVISV